MRTALHKNPNSIMEISCLAACLINPADALPVVNEVLRGDINHFSDSRNQSIYAYLQTNTPDVGCIYADLHHQFGGEFGEFGKYLSEMLESVQTSANARRYALGVLRES